MLTGCKKMVISNDLESIKVVTLLTSLRPQLLFFQSELTADGQLNVSLLVKTLSGLFKCVKNKVNP